LRFELQLPCLGPQAQGRRFSSVIR
jgi:hypothetical protein